MQITIFNESIVSHSLQK